MARQLLLTADGSHTVELEPGGETFHSRHGAIQESAHVYMAQGWDQLPKAAGRKVSVLEMGLGTGLNVLLTLLKARSEGVSVYYEALELYPLEEALYTSLNYCSCLQKPELHPVFLKIHEAEWEQPVQVEKGFELIKKKVSLTAFIPGQQYSLIYFDAFSPNNQGDLWTIEQFSRLYQALEPGGLLVTYCSKSDVRRAMQAAGFTVGKVPGPWGKRDMVQASKI